MSTSLIPPICSGGLIGARRNSLFGQTPDEATAASLVKKLEAKLDVYDQILSKQKYLGGDEVTLADLFHLPYGVLLPAAGSNAIEARPNVARWFKSLTDRPSWQAVKDGITATA